MRLRLWQRHLVRFALGAFAAVVALLTTRSAFASMPAGFCDERGATMIADLPAMPIGSETIDADDLPCDQTAGSLSATTVDGSDPGAPPAPEATLDWGMPNVTVALVGFQPPTVLSYSPPTLAAANGHELGCDRPPRRLVEGRSGPRARRAGSRGCSRAPSPRARAPARRRIRPFGESPSLSGDRLPEPFGPARSPPVHLQFPVFSKGIRSP